MYVLFIYTLSTPPQPIILVVLRWSTEDNPEVRLFEQEGRCIDF